MVKVQMVARGGKLSVITDQWAQITLALTPMVITTTKPAIGLAVIDLAAKIAMLSDCIE